MKITAFMSAMPQTLQQKQSKPILTGTNTGYATMVGMGLTMATGMSKNKNIRKSHWFVAFLTVTSAGLHLIKVLSYKQNK